ncbi:MAG: hypothetical protein Kow002_08700 [Anaerolineales bacterium]
MRWHFIKLGYTNPSLWRTQKKIVTPAAFLVFPAQQQSGISKLPIESWRANTTQISIKTPVLP